MLCEARADERVRADLHRNSGKRVRLPIVVTYAHPIYHFNDIPNRARTQSARHSESGSVTFQEYRIHMHARACDTIAIDIPPVRGSQPAAENHLTCCPARALLNIIVQILYYTLQNVRM